MSWRRLLSHGQGWPGLVPPSEGPSGGPGRLVPQGISGSFSRGTSASTLPGEQGDSLSGLQVPSPGEVLLCRAQGWGAEEGLEPRRLKTRTRGQFHPYPFHSLGPARLSVAGVRGQMAAGSGARPGGEPSLSPQKPPTLMAGTVAFSPGLTEDRRLPF